jgi:DNA-binding MarR family transcriptional regulator
MQATGDSQLIEKIFTFSRLMKEKMSYDTGFLHLTLLQIQTLLFLHHNPQVQMRDIAAHFSIEMPTATNLIHKLVKEDLVTRQLDDEDRRLVRILLTQKGQKLLEDAIRERNQKLSLLLSRLPKADKENLLRIISMLTATMEVSHET